MMSQQNKYSINDGKVKIFCTPDINIILLIKKFKYSLLLEKQTRLIAVETRLSIDLELHHFQTKIYVHFFWKPEIDDSLTLHY